MFRHQHADGGFFSECAFPTIIQFDFRYFCALRIFVDTYPLQQMKKLYILLFLSFLILPGMKQLLGQTDPVLRIEIETKSDEANYRLTPCGEKGLMLFYRTTLQENDYNFWIFILYNKFMKEIWKEDIPIFESMSYQKQVLIGDDLYVFFYNDNKKKDQNYNFQVLKINLELKRYELFSGLIPDEGTVAAFDVFGPNVLIGLNLPNWESGLYSFNLQSKEIIVAAELKELKTRLENLYLDTVSGNVSALFNVFNNREDQYLQLNSFDTIMKETGSIRFTAEAGKKFNTGKIKRVSGNRLLVFGTYDLIKGQSVDDKDYFVSDASGFFVINFTNQEKVTTRYENFLDLENMTGYLKSREYQLAKKKQAKVDEQGEKISLGYNLLLHDIREHDSMFYFVGEGYYEDYHMVTNTYYDFYGRAMPVSYDVFDGYRYFNAFISCYDQQGDKLWDNGMEIFNILSFDLITRVNIFFAGKETVMAYNRDGKISAKIIKGSETSEGVDNFPLETTYTNDKIMSDTKSTMEHWYDNYFVAYGFQTIRNNSLTNSKRTVFYINKVAFE